MQCLCNSILWQIMTYYMWISSLFIDVYNICLMVRWVCYSQDSIFLKHSFAFWNCIFKCGLQETLNLSMCADNSSNKKKNKKNMCHVLFIVCHVLHVTCHKSLMPLATASVPHPTNSPIMHIRMGSKDQKLSFFCGSISDHFFKKYKIPIPCNFFW